MSDSKSSDKVVVKPAVQIVEVKMRPDLTFRNSMDAQKPPVTEEARLLVVERFTKQGLIPPKQLSQTKVHPPSNRRVTSPQPTVSLPAILNRPPLPRSRPPVPKQTLPPLPKSHNATPNLLPQQVNKEMVYPRPLYPPPETKPCTETCTLYQLASSKVCCL